MENILKNDRLSGSILIKDFPEVAQKVSAKIEALKPLKSNPRYMRHILERFCEIKGITRSDVSGLVFSHDKSNNRLIFIAIILLFYDPAKLLFNCNNVQTGITKELSKLLKCRANLIAVCIRTIIDRYSVEKAFKSEINELFEKIKINT